MPWALVSGRRVDQGESRETTMAVESSRTFPEVQGGGSLILAWRIKDKKVVVVGGGEVCRRALRERCKQKARLTKVYRSPPAGF